jgi:hypothetical protein
VPAANTPTLAPPRAAEGTAEATPAKATPAAATAAQATPAQATPAQATPPPTASTAETPADAPTQAQAAPTQAQAAPIEAPAGPIEWLQFTPQIRVDRARGVVVCDIVSVLDVGFLEQYVCAVGTREHESLFVFEGKASELHAAMLLAGLTPGKPGSWREVPPQQADAAEKVPPTEEAQRLLSDPTAQNQRFIAVPPSGEALTITVELPDGSTHPLTYFVRASPIGLPAEGSAANGNGESAAPPTPPNRFVFAGSRFRTDQRTGVERYIADGSGSIVGLVTFGDETIAAVDVIPDQVAAAEPVWEVFTERMPKPGTRGTLRIERARPRRRRVGRTSLDSTDLGNTGANDRTERSAGEGTSSDQRKKARPRQSLRPSPSGGEWTGRRLPTPHKLVRASADSKGFLVKSPRKVNIVTDVSGRAARTLRSDRLPAITQAESSSTLALGEGIGGATSLPTQDMFAALTVGMGCQAQSLKEARLCIS